MLNGPSPSPSLTASPLTAGWSSSGNSCKPHNGNASVYRHDGKSRDRREKDCQQIGLDRTAKIVFQKKGAHQKMLTITNPHDCMDGSG